MVKGTLFSQVESQKITCEGSLTRGYLLLRDTWTPGTIIMLQLSSDVQGTTRLYLWC